MTDATTSSTPTAYGNTRGPSTLADPGGTRMNPAPTIA